MLSRRFVILSVCFVAAASRVPVGFEENNIDIDREVTEEEDPLEYNIEHGHGNFQGDMMLTPEQLEMMKGNGMERSLAVSNWPRTGSFVNIPYTLDENNNWNTRESENIQNAMQEYREKTCIRFVERTTEDDYIHIIHVHSNPDRHGCWSLLGRRGGKQELSLWSNGRSGCAYTVGTPIHEFMHAIGYLHEQSRKDRDQYVKINFENIKDGMASQFTKCEGCDLQGLPYDTGSVMHYHANAFSNGNGPTIESLDDSQLGQRAGFSALDLMGINMIYCECSSDADCSGSGSCNGGVCSGGTPNETTSAEPTEPPTTTVAPTEAPTTPTEEICIDIKVVTKRWGNENSWTFGGCASTQEYQDRATTTERCCQPAGDYELVCMDSYKDGWHGGYLVIDGKKHCKRFRSGHEKKETATMGKVTRNYTSKTNTYCKDSSKIGKYSNLALAQQHCSNNDQCKAITDNQCDDLEFWTCKNSNLVPSSTGSCSWLKE